MRSLRASRPVLLATAVSDGLPMEASTMEGRRKLVDQVCSSIHTKLGLQASSVQNQIAHVTSLWESFLLRQTPVAGMSPASASLRMLRDTLLRTQRQWEADVWQPFCAIVEQRGGGRQHARNGRLADPSASQDLPLRDVCLYLLLWGELGNLRFCPELLSFLFAAARSHLQWLPPGMAHWALGTPAPVVTDGDFLQKIVKPLYRAVASETFDLQSHAAPKFKFSGGPAPAKAANYDDWNELFWDPKRLSRWLHIQEPEDERPRRGWWRRDGSTRVSQVGVEHPRDLWRMLEKLDWHKSFSGRKSHLESHSLLPMLVGSWRIFLAQTSLLALVLLCCSKDPPFGTWTMRAAMGIIAPAFWWFHTIALHCLTPGIPVRRRSRDFCRLIAINTLPVYTFVVVAIQENVTRLIPMVPWVKLFLPDTGESPLWLLAIHFAFSFYVFWAAVAPRPQNVYRWRFYPKQAEQTSWALVVFWILVIGSKLAFEYVICSTVNDAIRRSWTLDGGGQGAVWDVAMLVVHILVLATPVALASFATIAFFLHFWIGIVGAIRGTRAFGGIELCCNRRGLGMTVVPEYAASRLMQVPHVPPPRSSMFDGLRWWRRMGDQELEAFVTMWNRMLEELHSRDFLTEQEHNDMSFESVATAREGEIPALLDPTALFKPRLPRNAEARRRIVTLARSLQMRVLPRGQVRTMPSLTVLIPHYSETIVLHRDQLFTDEASSELLRFLIQYYADEFKNFVMRMQKSGEFSEITGAVTGGVPGSFSENSRDQTCVGIEKSLCMWATQRLQTLWRTVEGFCHAYEEALSMVLQQQEGHLTKEQCKAIVKDRFQVIVAMQQYYKFSNPSSPAFDIRMAAAAEALLRTFGSCMSIAYIEEEKTLEGIRYYSCFIDDTCPHVELPAGTPASRANCARKPKYRIELPGFPVLGNGKSDNQNCAIVFTRGEIMQMIDANQDAYFESALFIPLALQEFNVTRRDGLRPGILGFREHIFSNIGLLGKWAAASEFAFGTVVQRTMDWPLQARLHYGHPDMMDKLQMIQQGGVSKATRGLNLSEDVFAGLDLTLRGGWTKYREYFHVGKGRDMSFMSILGFHAKVSMGNGEQATTRQWMRLALELPLPRYATIFFTHIGWYFNQCLINRALKSSAFLAALFAISKQSRMGIGEAAANLITHYYGIMYLLYAFSTMLPLTAEVLIEEGFIAAMRSLCSSIIKLNPVFASFQSKLMDYHFLNTMRYGGAKYIPTGRGLATSREPFLKLFRAFAVSHFHDAVEILLYTIMSIGVDFGLGFYLCTGVTVFSWLMAPLIFNPFQFAVTAGGLRADVGEWWKWLLSGAEREEDAWWAWAASSLQDCRRSRASCWVMVPSMRLMTALCTLVITLVVAPLPSAGQDQGVLAWIQAVLVILPPLLHIFICMGFACVRTTDHGKNLFATLALIAVASSAAELLGTVRPTKYSLEVFRAAMFHKYIALRFLLEVADGIAARKFTSCGLCYVQRTARLWSLSWRWLRDALLGTCLLLVCMILTIIPNSFHTAFLFRTRRLQAEASTGGEQDDPEGGRGSSRQDDLLRKFFNHFSPRDAGQLVTLLEGSLTRSPAGAQTETEGRSVSLTSWFSGSRASLQHQGEETPVIMASQPSLGPPSSEVRTSWFGGLGRRRPSREDGADGPRVPLTQGEQQGSDAAPTSEEPHISMSQMNASSARGNKARTSSSTGPAEIEAPVVSGFASRYESLSEHADTAVKETPATVEASSATVEASSAMVEAPSATVEEQASPAELPTGEAHTAELPAAQAPTSEPPNVELSSASEQEKLEKHDS